MSLRNFKERAEFGDIFARSLVSPLFNNTESFLAFHPAVAYLHGQVIKQARKAEFNPFEIMMDGNKIAINVRVVIIAGLGPLRPSLKPATPRNTEIFLPVPT